MRDSSFGQTLLAISVCILLASCGFNSSNADRDDAVSFLAFGDSGYNYNYIKQPRLTKRAYLHEEKASWAESFRPPGDFQAVPKYEVPGTGFVIQKSGAAPVAKAMINYCESNKCSFGVMLGDNIYPGGATGTDRDAEIFANIFENTYAELGVGVSEFKLYAALGNHDWKTSAAGRRAQLEYAMDPSTKVQMYRDGYYSFVKGDAEFFVLDTGLLLSAEVVYESKLNIDGSEIRHNVEKQNDHAYPIDRNNRTQLDWFMTSISDSKAKWKIVYGHHTLWSSGGDKFEQSRVLRKLLMPTICSFADMYIAGHEHFLEVSVDSCEAYRDGDDAAPIPLIVSGAASKQRSTHSPYLRYLENTHPEFDGLWRKGMTWGFVHITLKNDDAIVSFISTPNSGSGVPIVEKSLTFARRSSSVR